ncbi:YcxB family protein [Clostridium sulfidigenes]|uniref:YcxB family protein n=1 Tax=Clostridium sulfidigenes TaxID=318464 RepID=UPI003F8BB4DC
MENQELKFKFSTKDSVKNLAEAKIIIGRKKLFLSRLVIILIISIIALTFILYVIDLYKVSFVEALEMYFSHIPLLIIDLVIILYLIKMPEVNAWIRINTTEVIRPKELKNPIFSTCFYETYFSIGAYADIIDTPYTFNYEMISHIYITKNLFLIKANTLKGYIVLPKNSLTLGNIKDFMSFLENSLPYKSIIKEV